MMVELQITLPDWAGAYIQEQVNAGYYGTPSDCLADLIEKARSEGAEKKLAELIMEGENSGPGVEYSDESWEGRRNQIIAELKKKSA
jgi:antitoxin ParD1/3/4